MKTIKGLIVKDILNLSHYKISILIVIMVRIGLGVSNKDTLTYMPIMLMTAIRMIGLSTFSYDEMSKADKYLLTFPTNKKEIVKAKYILIIGMIIIGAIISIIATYGINYIVYKQEPEIVSILTMVLGGVFGISLVECIQIPSVYKWGAEKGRIQMFVLIILIGALIGGVIFLITNAGLSIQFNANEILKFIKEFGIYILIAIIILMYFLSYKLSCKIYMKKEI